MAARPDLITIPPEEMTGHIRNRLVPANRNLKLLNPTYKDSDDYKEQIAKNPRLKYAGMRAHMEMAAQAIAVGATQKMAAKYAGVSPRQIKKYYTDPDFRTRIEELRNLLTSRIKGKILRELNRRTNGAELQNMELMDILRIFDRIAGPQGGKGMHLQVDGDVNVNNYDGILAALFPSNSGPDGGDFPTYESSGLRLPSGDSPVDEEI
jgi:hypothetical protein